MMSMPSFIANSDIFFIKRLLWVQSRLRVQMYAVFIQKIILEIRPKLNVNEFIFFSINKY